MPIQSIPTKAIAPSFLLTSTPHPLHDRCFAVQITQWLTHLPGDKQQLGENYELLRLLTKDLTDIQNQGKPGYKQFYQTVIHPKDLLTENDKSRQNYTVLSIAQANKVYTLQPGEVPCLKANQPGLKLDVG